MPKIKLYYMPNNNAYKFSEREVKRNAYYEDGNYVIDLHRFNISEAVKHVEHIILHEYCIKKISLPLEIIFGRGLHSESGDSKLREPIIKKIIELKNMGYVNNWKYNECKKGGAIIVFINSYQ